MNLIIKGMEMPKSCLKCRLKILTPRGRWACRQVTHKAILVDSYQSSRHPDCPLVEIPTPHGDLIDRDRALYELCESNMPKIYRDFCRRVLTDEELTPTIIKSEE